MEKKPPMKRNVSKSNPEIKRLKNLPAIKIGAYVY